jgi:lipopolysaccharide biosynthesis regulator YciM
MAVSSTRRKRDVQRLYTEGLDYLLQRNYKEAYRCFKGVVEGDTDHIPAYLKLGRVLRKGNSPDRALQLHTSLLARPSLTTYERIELHKELALDYTNLKRYDDTIEQALAILKIDKRNNWALRQLVYSYRQLGDWAAVGKHLALWQKAVKKEDTRLLALCRFRQGYDKRDVDPPSAVRDHYRQALKIDEAFAPAHYYLANSYADEAGVFRNELAATERSPDQIPEKQQDEMTEKISKLYTQAVAHWSAFVELAPSDTFMVLSGLEDTLFYLQRFDDVEPFLQQVLDKDPDNPDSIACLANFYARRGDLDRAEQTLGTIPDDATNSPLIRAIQFKLDYRRKEDKNLMPEIDRLIEAVRRQSERRYDHRTPHATMMSWLDPSSDPLENLE